MSLVYSGTMEVPAELTLFLFLIMTLTLKTKSSEVKINSYTCGNYFKQVALSVYV